jgi:hypothetical protein
VEGGRAKALAAPAHAPPPVVLVDALAVLLAPESVTVAALIVPSEPEAPVTTIVSPGRRESWATVWFFEIFVPEETVT